MIIERRFDMSSKIENLDWVNLGFSYVKTDFRYASYWENGAWDKRRADRRSISSNRGRSYLSPLWTAVL